MIRTKRNKHVGAVLIMVLGMLMLMSIIVSLFLNDIMEEAYLKIQLSGKAHLRHQAYNTLNYIIGYLEQCWTHSIRIDFTKGGPQEIKLNGTEGIKIYVQLADESGKAPLNKKSQNLQKLKPLFCLFGDTWDAQMLAQSYLIWTQRKAVESELIEQNEWRKDNTKRKTSEEGSSEEQTHKNKILFPCNLNLYTQLKEIDKFRTMFFDEKGNPNEKLERLKNCSSLYNMEKININSANKDTLEALSKNFSLDLDLMENYLGLSEYNKTEPKFYKSLKEINTLGHGHLSFSTKTDRDMKQIDCRDTLSVDSSLVSATITVLEADTSFALKVFLFCEKQKLTKTSKSNSLNLKKVQIKSLVENY